MSTKFDNDDNSITNERRRQSSKPDTISFNTVLLAWARQKNGSQNSNNNVAGNRAKEILRHMEKLYKAGNTFVEPDVYSYILVL